MKFLVSKDLHSNSNFTLLLGFYALMMLLYFIGDIFYLYHFFGSNISEVISTLKGNPDEYIEPLELVSFLEHIHISLFLAILALFTTMAICLRLDISFRHKKIIILLSMSALLISFFSLVSGYFFNDIFIYGFVIFGLLWHLIGIYALVLTLKQVWFQ